MKHDPRLKTQAGFSLMELMVSMGVVSVMMGAATSLLVGGFHTRLHEEQKIDAIADTQRVLNIVSREVANSGFALQDNGLVSADCSTTSVRFRANLNAFDGQPSSADTSDANEDVKFYINTNATDSYLVRYDVNTSDITVLGNRIDSFNIHYYDSKVTYTSDPVNCDIKNATLSESASKSTTTYIVFTACVKLLAVGSPGSPGYAPASHAVVTSDVSLRNAASGLNTY